MGTRYSPKWLLCFSLTEVSNLLKDAPQKKEGSLYNFPKLKSNRVTKIFYCFACLPALPCQIPACLMPSDFSYGLDNLLFEVALAREVSFAICILHGLTSALPFILAIAQHEKCRFCGRHVMASIHNKNRL